MMHLVRVLETVALAAAVISSLIDISKSTEDEENTYSHRQSILLNKLLNRTRYDSRLRPNLNGEPVVVSCDFYVASFGELDEIAMDYTVGIYLRQYWKDPRLRHDGINGDKKTLTLSSKMIHKIWVPDVFFSNEKSARSHDITVPNKLIRIHDTGEITYSQRLTLVLTCPMVLTHFPMDIQQCSMEMESFGYDVSDIMFRWLPNSSVEINPDMQLPQFELMEENIERTDQCNRRYSTGEFSCLKTTFYLRRKFGFFLLQTYIPSVLIVILSWISFWIHADAVPARISLGVTTVLTMTTQLSGSRASIPKVSYPKAIDVWMATCMLFVFTALIEYALVNVLSRQKKGGKNNKKTEKIEENHDHRAGEAFEMRHVFKEREKPSPEPEIQDTNCVKTRCVSFLQLLRCPINSSKSNLSRSIDNISRYGFPITFFLFNVVYWAVYSNNSPL